MSFVHISVCYQDLLIRGYGTSFHSQCETKQSAYDLLLCSCIEFASILLGIFASRFAIKEIGLQFLFFLPIRFFSQQRNEFGSTLIFIFTDYFEEHWYSGSSDVWWDAAEKPSSSWSLHWAAATSSVTLSMIDFFSFLDSCNDCVSKRTVDIFQSIETYLFFQQRVLFFYCFIK